VKALVEHLNVIIQNYCNEQAIKTYYVVSPKSTTKNRKISSTNADFTTTVDKNKITTKEEKKNGSAHSKDKKPNNFLLLDVEKE